MDVQCSAEGCDRVRRCKEWCKPHYQRWLRNGETPSGPVAQPREEAERFWSYVDRSRGEAACWPWTGTRNWRGYGMFYYRGKTRHAHRVALSIPNDLPPSDVVVMHTCDNRPCCNPRHLRRGTVAENNHDMIAKGRAVKPPVRRLRLVSAGEPAGQD
jgi:hypothetical protein